MVPSVFAARLMSYSLNLKALVMESATSSSWQQVNRLKTNSVATVKLHLNVFFIKDSFVLVSYSVGR